MKARASNLLATAVAPAIWGSTYVVTTELLPGLSPLLVAMLRALPAGLLLLLIVRQLPSGIWWLRVFILGALNFSIFWSMLFVSAYRLAGGVRQLLERHSRQLSFSSPRSSWGARYGRCQC